MDGGGWLWYEQMLVGSCDVGGSGGGLSGGGGRGVIGFFGGFNAGICGHGCEIGGCARGNKDW